MRGVEHMAHLYVIPIHIRRRERTAATGVMSGLGVAGSAHCWAIALVIVLLLGALATALSVGLSGAGNAFRENASQATHA